MPMTVWTRRTVIGSLLRLQPTTRFILFVQE
jgi:hypothetical protein